MAIKILNIGKSKNNYLVQGVQDYIARLGKYAVVHWVELQDAKKKNYKTVEELKKLEADIFLSEVKANTYLIGLDENGKGYTSRDFAKQINTWTRAHGDVTFVIGGAFGFHENMFSRMNAKISLSRMTLSHQMVRLLLVEQIYRGYSILNGEPYHND
ncbi:MAG: 23S rRNA (pseudouridine1915-N3)-methyltransferase [Bacteroidia bacterium]|jgi:23S rRNA (pseudouridine1915-N3)-methyltransferase